MQAVKLPVYSDNPALARIIHEVSSVLWQGMRGEGITCPIPDPDKRSQSANETGPG